MVCTPESMISVHWSVQPASAGPTSSQLLWNRPTQSELRLTEFEGPEHFISNHKEHDLHTARVEEQEIWATWLSGHAFCCDVCRFLMTISGWTGSRSSNRLENCVSRCCVGPWRAFSFYFGHANITYTLSRSGNLITPSPPPPPFVFGPVPDFDHFVTQSPW